MTGQEAVPAAEPFEVITIDPAVDPRWQALLSLDTAGVFHSPPWLRAISDAYPFELQAYLAIDSESRTLGGLLFSRIDDLAGRRIVSAPFSDTCDPLLVTPDVWPPLLAEMRKDGSPVYLRCLHDQPALADPALTVTKRARWHSLDLEGDDAEMWRRLDTATRRAIRKAERSGVTVRALEGAAGAAEFHRLHVELRKRKYRLLAQPLAFLEAIRRRFTDADGWFPLGAYAGDRLIAATVFLRWKETLYYKFNASSEDGMNLRPNSLLGWAGVSLARSLGCRRLDFGPSDDNQPGLIRFKRQFGADERELLFLSCVPYGWSDQRGVEFRRLLGELTRRATAPDVSDDVTRDTGALLYRFFA